MLENLYKMKKVPEKRFFLQKMMQTLFIVMSYDTKMHQTNLSLFNDIIK